MSHSPINRKRDRRADRSRPSNTNWKQPVPAPTLYRGGNCTTACHVPHSAEETFLLSKHYPSNTYTTKSGRNDETYGLCFQCHSTDLLNKNLKNGDETGFRKDAQVRKRLQQKNRIERTNLHWLHVVGGAGPSGNNGFNGMERSCAACHSAHGTDQPFMIKSSITIENIFAGTVETGDDGDPLSLDFQ